MLQFIILFIICIITCFLWHPPYGWLWDVIFNQITYSYSLLYIGHQAWSYPSLLTLFSVKGVPAEPKLILKIGPIRKRNSRCSPSLYLSKLIKMMSYNQRLWILSPKLYSTTRTSTSNSAMATLKLQPILSFMRLWEIWEIRWIEPNLAKISMKISWA